MLTPMRNRMRRHTRPAGYVSKSRKAEAVAFSRPGSRAFSFTGEFPDMADQQVVETAPGRRQYTARRANGSYQAVRQDEPRRMPPINRYGVHFVTALCMLFAFVVVLGSIFVARIDQRAELMNLISSREASVSELTAQCERTRSAIQAQSNDVNIRKEAVRMGLISSKGVAVHYLEAPSDAVITTMRDQSVIQSIASIWGN
ncbi:MAG: hypothetical protein PUC00_09880 [Clostridiales bacterium]|nr:hypothetical protein [Clostridiales bacterium]